MIELDERNATLYTGRVIRSFRHKGLRRFFDAGSRAGIQPAHAARLARMLHQLDAAKAPEDMAVPGWKLHPLTGEDEGRWSVWVSGNWRLTFAFEDGHATEADYVDYH